MHLPQHRAMRWLWLWLWVLIRCGQQVMPVDELRENQARAQVYLTALADYYTVHTQFPPNLTAIDVQLSGPLMTTLGTPFSYSRSETVGYFLCFGTASYRGCCYHHYLDLWDCTAGDE